MILKKMRFLGFSGGNLTSDSGYMLYDMFLDEINLHNSLQEIRFMEDRKNYKYSNEVLIETLLMLKLTGYHKATNLEYLVLDPFLNSSNKLCSNSTISRFYNRTTQSSNSDLKQLNYSYAYDYLNKRDDVIILDIDSSHTETYGKQQGSSYIPHYNSTGYHPILVTDFNSGLILNEYLRCGNTYTGNGACEILSEVLPRLDKKNEIFLRADSGYHNEELFKYLATNNVKYAIKAKGYGNWKKTIIDDLTLMNIDDSIATKNNPHYDTIEKNHYEGDFYDIHYMAYFDINPETGMINNFPTIQMIVSNIRGSSAEVFEFYRKRAAAENNYKELKDDFGANTLSHKAFVANELDFTISCLAYNIHRLFNLLLLPNHVRTQGNTTLMRLIKIAGKVTKHSGNTSIALASSAAYQNLFTLCLNRLL